MLKLNITYSGETIVIENSLRIILNVDNNEGRVWGATLVITGVNEYEKEKKKFETYNILEKIRKDNNLKWNKEILLYFKTNTS